jgi:decaprenyl-phosphate phosphoribosyltransferase
VAAYLVLTGSYTLLLKNVVILDILAIAAGFILRVIGGATATNTTPSSWLLLTVLCGSLFLVTAKRLGERSRPGPHRSVLAEYSAPWLQQTLTTTATMTVMAYAAWAFDNAGHDISLPLLAASALPFIAGLMRYSLLVSRGAGETPEAVVVADRFLVGAGLIWLAAVWAAIYLV